MRTASPESPLVAARQDIATLTPAEKSDLLGTLKQRLLGVDLEAGATCSLACIKEQASNNCTNPLGCLVRCFRNYELGLCVTKLIEIAETKHS